jgi:hypothetical protein
MDIEQRFAHLERSNRRLRTGLLSLTIAITTVLIVGLAKPEKVPDVIQAKEFQVVNDKGKILVRMGAPLDRGVLTTYNDKMQILVDIGGLGKGAITTYNGKGQRLVRLGDAAFGGWIEIYNGEGQDIVALGLPVLAKRGAVWTKNEKGKLLVAVSGETNGGSVITYDGNDRATGHIGKN